MLSMVLMWLATISREPGGLAAFATQVAAAERGVGAGAVLVEHAAVREQVREAGQYEEMCEGTESVGQEICRALPSDLGSVD